MTEREIIHYSDCTVLKQDVTWDQVRQACCDGLIYHPAQIAVPPAFVRPAKEFVGDRLKIGTGVGYPNGYNTTEVKLFETEDALRNGADEIDMVIHIGAAKEGRFDDITREIRAIKSVCGDSILKVIIETYFLTLEEKIRLCDCVTEGGADFIKTSTGFVQGGATMDDIRLLLEHIGPGVRVKASGGISTFDEARAYLEAGVMRIGTSRLLKLIKQHEARS